MSVSPLDFGMQYNRRERHLVAISQICRIWKNRVPADHDSSRTMETIVHEIECRRHRQSCSPMLLESLQAVLCHVCEHDHPAIRAVCVAEGRENDCWLIGTLD